MDTSALQPQQNNCNSNNTLPANTVQSTGQDSNPSKPNAGIEHP